jgi:plastocyanin
MKRSSSAARHICWLIVVFAVAGFSPSEFGGEHKAIALERESTATPIIILGQQGRVVPNNAPSATSSIFDVAVGPNNALQFVPNTVTVTVGANCLCFMPSMVTIHPGDTVQWSWSSSGHSSSSGTPGAPNGIWDSGILNLGATFSHTFNTPGSFPYYCTPHGQCCGMTGVVNVCTPPPADMVSWWAAEGNAMDALENNDAILGGGATFAPGEVGQAFSLDGTASFIEAPDSASLSIPGQLTIDAWIKPNNVANIQDIVSKYNSCQGAEQKSYDLAMRDSGAIQFCVYDGQGGYHCVETTTAITPGVFTHIAGTFDPATQAMKIYFNGVDTLAPIQPGSVDVNVIFDSTTPVDIGRTNCAGPNKGPTDYFGGLIDEVEIFNRALSATEVQAIANAGGAGKCRALQLTAAGSRKTHGGAGTFDINMPITGQSGVECRAGGDYTLVFTFSNGLLSGNAAVTGGTGTVSGSPTFSGRDMIVNVTGVTNEQILTVTLSNVTDVFNQVAANSSVNIGVLVGDANSNRTVNATDVAQTKSQVGQPVSMSNFREDVNANGIVSATDVAQVKSEVGTSLPP